MIRRINIFGGPGAGKSTYAAKLYVQMKEEGKSVELVQEFVKQFAYLGKRVQGWDCVYAFAKQLEAEHKMLQHVDTIITDSPLLLQCVYNQNELLKQLAEDFEREFSSINIFVMRKGKYVAEGRFETLEEAKKIDTKILETIVMDKVVI